MSVNEMIQTNRAGVFYIEHLTRSWTPKGKKTSKRDRQLILRYTIDGKTYKGVYGWESQGKTELDAENKIIEFRDNALTGGPVCLRDEKEAKEKAEKAQQQRVALEKCRNVTVADYFYDDYLKAAKENKKARTIGSEEALFKKWIEPTMGNTPIKDILPLDFQRLKNKVMKGDRAKDKNGKPYYVAKSPRTVHYCVSIVIQLWNMAFDNKVVDIQPPRRKTLNLPMIDNERTRAFTTEQAQKYFEHMDVRSKQWADITRASLFAGLRASEVLRLKVKDFDEQRGRLFLLSPKKQKSQNLVLNDSAFQLFKRLKEEHPTKEGLFFAIQNGERKGEQITEVSNTIQRAIDELGFNAGVTDRRDKLTFHSWRHTHATWLIDQGVDIHTVSALLRHSTLAMTRRYVHPHEEKLRNASRGIDNVFNVTGDQVNTGTEGNG